MLVTRKYVGVTALEHGAINLQHRLGDFLVAGPDILKKNRLAIRTLPYGIRGHINISGAGQGKGHHQRWAGQPVTLDLRMNPTFKVTVAGQHGRYHQIALVHRLPDGLWQGAGVPDASGATKTDQEIGRASCRERVEYAVE